MAEKMQCNGFTIEILKSHDDGSSGCPTCWYESEYEIETCLVHYQINDERG